MSYVRLLPFVLSNEDNTFTGVNTFQNRTISTYNAVEDTDVPNLATVKSYVGGGGFRPVNPVRAFVQTNLTLSGVQTVPNSKGSPIVLNIGDKVCASSQTNSLENARYVVQSSAWTLDTDCSIGSNQKYTIFSESSTGNQFQCTSDPGIVGTDALTYVLFSENTVLSPDDISIVFTSNVVSVKDSGISTVKLANNAVTYAKLQQASSVSLLGNPTGSTANIQEVTLGSSLTFTGSALNTIQSIVTSASPTFVSLLLTGLTANQAVATDSSKNLISLAYSASASINNLVSRDSNGNTVTNNFISKTAFVTSANGTTSLTPASSRRQVLTGSQPQTFVLPDASQLTVGAVFEFVNNSSGLLSIQDNSTAVLTTILAGGFKTLYVTDISTSAGLWDLQNLVPKFNEWGTAGLIANGYLSTPSLQIRGASSGTISILAQSSAGIYNFNLPTSPGSLGQILTSAGGGSAPMTWTNLSSIGVTSLSGNVNQVLINGGIGPAVGSITLSTPQDINITSNVQFETLGLGSSLVSSAILSLASTTAGFLPPRMTTTQRNAIASPATGLTIYNLTNNDLESYNGTSWVGASSSGVTSIAGTTNRIAVSASTGSVSIDIASTYVGQSSITTLGTISAGTWQSTIIGSAYGGTGINNGARTIDLTAGATGKILTSDSSGNASYTTLSGITVTSAQGVVNQVRVSGTVGTPQTGAIILSLPQDIATTSLVTFGQVSIGTTTQTTQINLSGAMTGTTTQYPLSIATNITPSATGGTGFSASITPTFNIGAGFTQTLAGGLIVESWSVTGSGTITTAIGARIKTPTGGVANIALAADNLNIGYATTNAISSGAMISGQVVIGTNNVPSTTKVQITANTAYALDINGTQTGSDGSNYQYGVYSRPVFSPFSGTYLTVAVAGIPTFSVASPDIISNGASFRASNLFTGHTGVINKAYGFWYDGGGVLSAGSIDYQWGGYFAEPAAGFNRLALYAKNMSIGDDTVFPSAGNLAVSGQVKTATLQVTTSPVSGYVLTSDASGNATWQAGGAGGGVSSLNPTANQIYLSASTGAIDIGLTNGISLGAFQSTAPPAGGILCNGNVTIGSSTTSGGVLTVSRSTDGVDFLLNFPSSGTFQISQFSGIQYVQTANAPMYLGTSTAHNVFVQTSNSIMTRFDTNGGVAIGGTYAGSSPNANGLSVQGRVGVGYSASTYFLEVNATSTSDGIRVKGASTNTQLVLNNTSGTTGSRSFAVTNNSGFAAMFFQRLTDADVFSSNLMSLWSNSGLSIGATFASTTAPANGLIVQGSVGIGISTTTNGFVNIVSPSSTTKNALYISGTQVSSSNAACNIIQAVATISPNFAGTLGDSCAGLYNANAHSPQTGCTVGLSTSALLTDSFSPATGAVITDASQLYVSQGSQSGAGTITNGTAAIIRSPLYGNIRIGVNLIGSDPAGSAIGSKYLMSMFGTQTGDDGFQSSGFLINHIIRPTTNNRTVSGVWVAPTFQAHSTNTINNAYGFLSNPTFTPGSGVITNSYAGYFVNPGAGTNRTALYTENLSVGYAGATPPTLGALIAGALSIGSATNTGALLNLTSGNMSIYEPANTARFIAIQRNGATLAQLDTSNAGCSLVNPTGIDMYFTNSSGTWGNWRGTGLAIGNGTVGASSFLDVFCGTRAYTECMRIIGSGAEPALALVNTSAGGRSWYLMSTGTGSGGPPGFGGFRIFNSLVGDTITIRSDGLVYIAKQFSQGQSTPATYTFHTIESASSYSYGMTLSGSITAVPGVANGVSVFNAMTLLGPNSSSADLTGNYINCTYTAGTGTVNNFYHNFTGTGSLSNTRVTNGYQHYIDALGTGTNRYGLRVLRPQTSGATIACTASFDTYVGIGSTNPQSPLHLLTNGVSALLRLEGNTADSVAISFQQANVQKYLIYVSGASSILRFNNGVQDVMSLDGNANIICNGSAISPSATNGFIYMPSCAGVPSGVPTSYTGRVPFVYDTNNNRIYIYNGSWKQVTLT